MSFRAIADLVLVAHALFVGFVVVGFGLILLGLARGWHWVRRPVFRRGEIYRFRALHAAQLPVKPFSMPSVPTLHGRTST
jgi:hypothetical protein